MLATGVIIKACADVMTTALYANSLRGSSPKRRDPYPLTQKPTPTWWSGFAPFALPLFYASAIVIAVCAAIWVLRLTF